MHLLGSVVPPGLYLRPSNEKPRHSGGIPQVGQEVSVTVGAPPPAAPVTGGMLVGVLLGAAVPAAPLGGRFAGVLVGVPVVVVGGTAPLVPAAAAGAMGSDPAVSC